MKRSRRKYRAAFKAKVPLAALAVVVMLASFMAAEGGGHGAGPKRVM